MKTCLRARVRQNTCEEIAVGKTELELARQRISHYLWFARRYRDDASEEQYRAEEAFRTTDPEMEKIHREGAASAIRIARLYEQEAERLERAYARD
jgi:hypothetical protein